MGFRNPLTSLSADQITAGTLPSDVVGQALQTAATGRRVVISSPAGDAGRIDFYSDPNDADHTMHAEIEAYAFGGVSSRGYLDLTPDSAGIVRLGSHDLPAGGYATAVDLIAQQVLVGTGTSVQDVAADRVHQDQRLPGQPRRRRHHPGRLLDDPRPRPGGSPWAPDSSTGPPEPLPGSTPRSRAERPSWPPSAPTSAQPSAPSPSWHGRAQRHHRRHRDRPDGRQNNTP